MIRCLRSGILPRLLLGSLLAIAVAPAGARPLHRTGETISYSSRACGSGCPLYRVAIRPSGRVTTGSGGRGATRYVDPAVYRDLAASLRPYRPATGTTAQTTCEHPGGDEALYRITWLGRRSVTTLEHQVACASPRNAVLNAILIGASARIGARDSMTGAAVPAVVRPSLPKPHIFYF